MRGCNPLKSGASNRPYKLFLIYPIVALAFQMLVSPLRLFPCLVFLDRFISAQPKNQVANGLRLGKVSGIGFKIVPKEKKNDTPTKRKVWATIAVAIVFCGRFLRQQGLCTQTV